MGRNFGDSPSIRDFKRPSSRITNNMSACAQYHVSERERLYCNPIFLSGVLFPVARERPVKRWWGTSASGPCIDRETFVVLDTAVDEQRAL